MVPINRNTLHLSEEIDIINNASASLLLNSNGTVTFEKVPSASYSIYLVQDGNIIAAATSSYVYVDRHKDIYSYMYVNLNSLRLHSQEKWNLVSAIQYGSAVELPVSSISFNEDGSAKLSLSNGNIFYGTYTYNGNNYVDLRWQDSNNESIYTDAESISFDEQGRMIIKLAWFEFYNYNTGSYFQAEDVVLTFS